ncbi:MAG: DUF2797 domain-containing protein [Candidatus Thermoplasmatota archaeon]|jgi:hypothetical protein|nr:DUF2797 domain-containing protein [Candidatus Thermoplasmatota archaeon]
MMNPIPNGTDRGFPFNSRFHGTLFEESSGEVFHVLGMGWERKGPVLHLRAMEGRAGSYHYIEEVLSLDIRPGRSLDLNVSLDVRCTGRMEVSHVPCPGRAVMEGFVQCHDCLVQDVPDPVCIFEPHCRSGQCGAFFCQAPHVVYAAVYGDKLKIGMTQLNRVEERGMEQGADVIQPLVQVADRYSARQLEGWISARYRIPQAYPSKVLLKDLARRTDIELCKDLAWKFMERLRDDQLVMGDILNGRGIRVEVMPREMDVRPLVLGPYPIPSVLDVAPRKVGLDILKGEIVGAKGKWCILKNGPTSAFKMPDIVGRLIMSGTDLRI